MIFHSIDSTATTASAFLARATLGSVELSVYDASMGMIIVQPKNLAVVEGGSTTFYNLIITSAISSDIVVDADLSSDLQMRYTELVGPTSNPGSVNAVTQYAKYSITFAGGSPANSVTSVGVNCAANTRF